MLEALRRDSDVVEEAGAEGLDFAADVADEAKAAFTKVRNVGNRAFYWRDGRWTDSQVTKQQESNAIRIKQFSDAYFDLALCHGKKLSRYLIFDEPLLICIEEQTYLIEP